MDVLNREKRKIVDFAVFIGSLLTGVLITAWAAPFISLPAEIIWSSVLAVYAYFFAVVWLRWVPLSHVDLIKLHTMLKVLPNESQYFAKEIEAGQTLYARDLAHVTALHEEYLHEVASNAVAGLGKGVG